MLPTDPEAIERGKLTILAMQQFERVHAPVRTDDPGVISGIFLRDEMEDGPEFPDQLIYCEKCNEDWPCNRMATLLITQSISALQSMIPTGNMSSVLQRFVGGGKS